MIEYNQYEDGYGVGYEEGRRRGVEEGYSEASLEYEHRLTAYWVEMQTLNARIDRLENIFTNADDTEDDEFIGDC